MFILLSIFAVARRACAAPEEKSFTYLRLDEASGWEAVDVALIVNCGGWGNVPLERSRDIFPTVKGIVDYLDSCGLKTGVVIYQRAPAPQPDARRPGLQVQVSALTEMLGFHRSRARQLAEAIENVARNHPGLKFIILGLSNGATFTNQTMELIAPAIQHRVFSIEMGMPFWRAVLVTENNLILTNEGADPLWNGEVEELFASLLRGLKDFICWQVAGKGGVFEEAWHIPGHDYRWERIKPVVSDFLRRRVVPMRGANSRHNSRWSGNH